MRELLARSPVVPVVTFEAADEAVNVAGALLEGGITCIEITLRTSAALSAIRAVRDQLPGIAVGAGTVLDERLLLAAQDAGAEFGVSPGATPALLEAVRRSGLPFLPGVATVSEAMRVREAGFTVAKLFPASVVGVGFLAAVAPVLPDLAFCPTGGITEPDATKWLANGNVLAVGGSWLVPKPVVAARAWGAIRDLAARACLLRRTALSSG